MPRVQAYIERETDRQTAREKMLTLVVPPVEQRRKHLPQLPGYQEFRDILRERQRQTDRQLERKCLHWWYPQ